MAPSRSNLGVASVSTDRVQPAGRSELRALIVNYGPDQTASIFTVKVTVPSGTSAVGPFFPSSCTTDENGSTVTCDFPAGLYRLQSATVQIPLQVQSGIPHGAVLSGGTITVSSPDDTTPGNNAKPYTVTVS
ncbi:hypothetical protein AB0N07_10955 [Streptomyces sp. NPDC051172]|uniref:hypothetical protein n=1 Tax=Streptomyces sp. NPDC051172 TaxID=3155796 RepID=UPI00343C3FE1